MPTANAPLSAQTESSIPSTPVTLVVGKGGVGKSTVARAIADLHAHAGRSAVRLSIDDTRAAAARAEGEDNPREAARDVALSWNDALTDAAADVFGSQRAARALLGNFAMRRLMNVLPGVREYSVLLASYRWRERAERVVVDMPATGHGLSWIDTVSLAAKIFPSGRISDRASALQAALRNPAVTSVVLVTLAEPVVSSESSELRAGLERVLGMPPALTVVNRSPHAPETSEEQLAALSRQRPDMRIEVDALRAWCDEQRQARDLVDDHPAPMVAIRRTAGDPIGAASRALAGKPARADETSASPDAPGKEAA